MAVSNYRLNVSRCKARMVEAPGTWRCQLRTGHPGEHVSYSGHRYWGREVRHKLVMLDGVGGCDEGRRHR